LYTISLTENQLHDIERRDKLQRLRAHENQNPIIKIPNQSSSIVVQDPTNADTPSTPYTLDEHIRRQKV
jgi:hypothetical protein